ncbi:hypothetical protein [Roseinatronobacter bogoriensis]|uniref:Mitochondrial inner membrane protein n=1 Tax=Roseinatronobacter bogoriensis subsp. barguzinensis TaxID=441209 RepID=A0A2K8KBY8_9RHOB|nr:hypothetical protein [Rhodobaca]ATX66496.1 hypothetical protein BG454_12310 [Rhodobaca barguzinensis]MBB4207656.1 hypothetical protein [Rhodobaca bogoriensis DSM 18756]TDW40037.1 hypothetical protein LY39_01069 [Rhodobaca barguzinensis]TDY70810.1 hypothetical protein EV660_102487 [Rhodobaca bogoriensis DSM 18756]
MARRTTRKKSPTSNASDAAGSEPTRPIDTNDPVDTEIAQNTPNADSDVSEGSQNSKLPEPPSEGATQSLEKEATVATAEEAQLAKDITPPEASKVTDDTTLDTPASGESVEPSAEDVAAAPEAAETKDVGTKPEGAAQDADLTSSSEANDKPDAPETIDPVEEVKQDSHEPNASAHPAPGAPAEQPQPRKSGFFPMLIGGLLAGGIGYGAAYMGFQQQAPSSADEISQIRTEIAGLRAELEDVGAPADLSALQTELAELRGQIGSGDEADLGPLQARFEDMTDGLSQQLGTVSEEVDSLRAALAEAEEQIAALGADMADLRDLGERRVAEAEAAVDVALAQSGLDSVRAALETGVPYPDAVSRLEGAGVRVPEALVAPAASGIPTLEGLQEDFPQAARAALRVALQDAPAESTADRLGNFLRAQTGARSTAPRQGDDADAILSRAGAALEAGDLEAALAEIAALPEPAQAAMGGWLNAAQARVAARDALPELINAISTE